MLDGTVVYRDPDCTIIYMGWVGGIKRRKELGWPHMRTKDKGLIRENFKIMRECNKESDTYCARCGQFLTRGEEAAGLTECQDHV